MYKPELLTIKEWCERYGIKIHKPNGFKGKKIKFGIGNIQKDNLEEVLNEVI